MEQKQVFDVEQKMSRMQNKQIKYIKNWPFIIGNQRQKQAIRMSNTSILQGIKAYSSKYSSNKFVIKSKPNIKQSKQTIDSEPADIVTATSKDIDLFLNYMKQRSSRFQELLAQNSILNQEEFYKKHLFSSICIRTILKAVLDKLLNDKRLGKNLKGMNKSNMQEVEKHIWPTLERQVALYQNERKYNWEKDQLKNDLLTRKRQILKELQNINLKYQSVEKELCQGQLQKENFNSQKPKWPTQDDQKTKKNVLKGRERRVISTMRQRQSKNQETDEISNASLSSDV